MVAAPESAEVGREISLDRLPLQLGRAAEAPGCLPDPSASRIHARIETCDQGELQVVDLGGANGTFVDGSHIAAPQALRTGGVVRIGDTLLVLDRPPPPGAYVATWDADEDGAAELLGRSYVAERIRRSLATIGPAQGSVLLLGPTGTGKEVAARIIHRLSKRQGPFVAINCAAIPEALAEAEFFGHRRGAFSGADADREGYFVAASTGTLFLDEIGELPRPLQAKLLRVLEDQLVRPLGGGEPCQVDVRIVAATQTNLEAVDFRSDLLARIAEWVVRLPPLAERRSDILMLFEHFASSEGRRAPHLSVELAEKLLLHTWPLNVRELRSFEKRIRAVSGAAGSLDLSVVPGTLDPIGREEEEGVVRPRLGKSPSREELEAALVESNGNVARAASRNGWHRTQMYRWIEKLKIDADKFRG